MLYLNEYDLLKFPLRWHETIGVIRNSIKCIDENDYSQPIKPYLRYRDLSNRIIAMPAFIGGGFDMAGIKWIASFPNNVQQSLPRAHSVLILNESATGKPACIINAALLSTIRTASVSGVIIESFDKVRALREINIGVIGLGPIGSYHLKMCHDIFGDKQISLKAYDVKQAPLHPDIAGLGIKVAKRWQEVYEDADILITCTVAQQPYIDLPPKKSSLHLNVSLRDYRPDVFPFFKDSIIVDSWEEVCREKTDVEVMALEKGLKKEQTRSIVDVVLGNCMSEYAPDQPIMFNPMGMAVFDIALGSYFMRRAMENKVGSVLV